MVTETIKFEKGSIIPFGNYQWLILDIQDGKALIISKDVIENRAYNAVYEDITWENCALREYLNSSFLQKLIADPKVREQQNAITETRIINSDNLWYNSNGGNDTTDKIFLLSLEEADKYFGDSGDYQNKKRKFFKDDKFSPDDNGNFITNIHDTERIACLNNENSWWLLRSPGSDNKTTAIVDFNGSICVDGANVSYNIFGIRPALWLKVNMDSQ
jgi:hypothetical protein